METNVYNIKFNKESDWHYLIPIGDVHLGHVGCDVKAFKKMVDWVKNKPNCLWIGMGDYLDCINYTDKRFDPTEVAHPYIDNLDRAIPLQMEDFIDMVRPIMNKCVGMHRGNHEEAIRLRYHYDLMYELWKEFKVPMLKDQCITRLRYTYNCKTKLKKPCYTFDVYSTHGNIGGRKGGAKVNRLEDMIGETRADVYLMGHAHIKLTETKTQRMLDNHNNLKYRKKILAVTGCFLRSSAYAEKGMFPPTDVGVVKLMFHPSNHDMHVSE